MNILALVQNGNRAMFTSLIQVIVVSIVFGMIVIGFLEAL